MGPILRLLEIVKRGMGADDARAELGGKPPDDPRIVYAPLGDSWRVVVIFEAPVADPEAKKEQLEILIAPFAEPDGAPVIGAQLLLRRWEVDEALRELSERAGARAALVFDERSPVLFGWSNPREASWDLEAMAALARFAEELSSRVDPAALLSGEAPLPPDVEEKLRERWRRDADWLRQLAPTWTRAEWDTAVLSARAVHVARLAKEDSTASHPSGARVFVKRMAQIYRVALVFDAPYSELRAEGHLVRALPWLESLVIALPPTDPPPKKAKVLSFWKPQ